LFTHLVFRDEMEAMRNAANESSKDLERKRELKNKKKRQMSCDPRQPEDMTVYGSPGMPSFIMNAQESSPFFLSSFFFLLSVVLLLCFLLFSSLLFFFFETFFFQKFLAFFLFFHSLISLLDRFLSLTLSFSSHSSSSHVPSA